MTLDIDVEIKGRKELSAKAEQIIRDMQGNTFSAAMGKATLLVMRSARKNAPVDTGRLRASITPEVVRRDNVVQGIVGSNVEYAPYQELGTRAFTPPIAPLWRWAMRKSKGNFKAASALFVAAMTSIRGRGIKPKRYLERAIKSNARNIQRLIGDAVGRIIRK